MKKIALLCLLIFTMCIAYAQTGATKSAIRYGKDYLYTSDIETDPCAGAQLSVNVRHSQSKLLCTITVDDKKISGFLVKNNDPSNKAYPNLYNFYRSTKPRDIYLFIKFYTDEDSYKADLINETWIQAFKPCFDHKMITLASE